jgi:hypothetical protein
MENYPFRPSPELRSKIQERIGAKTTDPSLIKAYQAEVIYQICEVEASHDELMAALDLNILDIKGSLLKVRGRKVPSKRGHPFRYRASVMPKARRENGKLVWLTQIQVVDTPITIKDIQDYALRSLTSLPDNGASMDGVFTYLYSEANNLISRKAGRQAEGHPISDLDPMDLLLFAIDAASLSDDHIRNCFRIQDYFNEGLDMYYDKVNA